MEPGGLDRLDYFAAQLAKNGVYYGFEFPDDEAKLQRLFLDNLPFALDVLDAARDPLHAHPTTTGIASQPVEFETVSPRV